MIGQPILWADEICPACHARWWARAAALVRCARCGFAPMARIRAELVFEQGEAA